MPVAVQAANYGTCILETVPGVRHQQVLRSAVRACQERYPEGLEGIKWGSGRGFFAKYKSTDECFAAEGRDTALNAAASQIFRACDRLYGEAPKPPVDWSQYELVEPPPPSRQP